MILSFLCLITDFLILQKPFKAFFYGSLFHYFLILKQLIQTFYDKDVKYMLLIRATWLHFFRKILWC